MLCFFKLVLSSILRLLLKVKTTLMKIHNKTILLADDDHDDLHLLSEALKDIDPSYSIMQAHDGENAIELLKEAKESECLPCLIVLDINMPKMDGKQALVTIQNELKLSEIPIVIFSTSSSEVDKMFFKNKNVEMITKPVEFEILYQVAVKMLNYCRS